MALYFLFNSQFAQGIWASICNGFATVALILIMLLGIVFMLGALGNRSAGQIAGGFTNTLLTVLRTIANFIAVTCIWRLCRWLAKKIVTFWKWLQSKMEKIFQKKLSPNVSKTMGGIAATLIIAAIIIII